MQRVEAAWLAILLGAALLILAGLAVVGWLRPRIANGAFAPRAVALDVRKAVIGGVGELGVPTLAPALANAVYALTHNRVRTLPFFPGAVMGGL